MRSLTLAAIAVLLFVVASSAHPPTPIYPLRDDQFTQVLPAPTSTVQPTVPDVVSRPQPSRPTVVVPTPHLIVVAVPRPSLKAPAHSQAGWASFYCKEGASACHYQYPPGSMVAAACGKLRVAMGPNWRGKHVAVLAANGNRVMVQLVDWCGSTTKLIDLYWEPMRRLGGTGVLRVVVSW